MNYFQRMHADGHILENCDWQCYLDRYPDLQANLGPQNLAAAERHWKMHGHKDRDCTCGNFQFYLCNYYYYVIFIHPITYMYLYEKTLS